MSDVVPSRADIWRCLIGSGVPGPLAEQICRSEPISLRMAFDATQTDGEHESAVGIQLLDGGTTESADAELAGLITRLGRLSTKQCQAVLAHHVAGLAVAELAEQVGLAENDLATGEALLTVGTSAAHSHDAASVALAPLADMTPPSSLTRSGRRSWVVASAATAMIAAIVAGQAVLATSLSPAPGEPVPVLAAQPSATAASTTSAPVDRSSTTARFVEPDREVEISVTDENTIVRLEPWTRRVIWESRPFRGAVEIVSVDPNTVTIDYAGNRLIVNLTDGTLLPP